MSRKAFNLTVPNENLKLYSEEWNAFIGAAQRWLKSQQNTLGGSGNYLTSSLGEIFDVASNDIYDFNQFDTLVVIGVWTPSIFDNDIYDRPALEVARYDGSELHNNSPIAVLQEPLFASNGNGTTAKAKLAGTSFVNVNITNQSHPSYKLVINSSTLESAVGGQLAGIANGGDGATVALGQIISEPPNRQFKVVAITEPDMVDCITYTDGIDGTEVVKVAMPWIIRRTPFDGVVGAAQRTPLIRYEYFSNIERRAFVKEDINAAEEEFDQIMQTPYYLNDIITASRNIIGFGTQDVITEDGEPVLWLDENESSRFWFQNEGFEE